MNFDDCFEFTVGVEGGYSNDPRDPGGETKYGVTFRTLQSAIKAEILPEGTTVKDLTLDQSKTVYRHFYWDPCQGDQLPGWLCLHVFDAAVNSGTKQAVLWLQRVLGAGLDGVVGPKTIGAARMADPGVTIARYTGERLQFMTETNAWNTYGKGWSRRIAKLLSGAQNV